MGSSAHRDDRPGLGYAGLEWQRSLSSASLRGVSRDAHYVGEAACQLLHHTTDPVKVLTQRRCVGARRRRQLRCDRTSTPHQSQRGFDTLRQLVDLRIQQGKKHSRLRDIGFFCRGHRGYDATSEDSFSPAMRSTSRGTKSRTLWPSK